MKITFTFSILILLGICCHKDPHYEPETDKHYGILKAELINLTNVPVEFYSVEGNVNSPRYVTSCLNTEIKFEHPHLIANGIKFHIDRWLSSQHITDSTGEKTSRMLLRFYPED